MIHEMIHEDDEKSNKTFIDKYSSNLHVQYALDKANYNFWKKLIFGIMGGVFAGLGYIAFNILNGGNYVANPITGNLNFVLNLKETGFFFGALIFPIGILMCLYLGGNLFTSNVLIVMGVFAKKVRIKYFIYDLFITLIGNLLGGIIMALVAFGSSIYWKYDPVSGFQINDVGYGVIYLANKKVKTEWWSNILSGTICNMIVAGAIYSYIKIENKGHASLLVYFFIVVFAICGFQHVVANAYIFTQASLIHTIFPNEIFGLKEMGESFYLNATTTIIGNIIGGVLISGVYMFVESERIKKQIKIKTKISFPKLESKKNKTKKM